MKLFHTASVMDSIVFSPLLPSPAKTKSYIEILTPVSQNVTLFRNTVIDDVIHF